MVTGCRDVAGKSLTEAEVKMMRIHQVREINLPLRYFDLSEHRIGVYVDQPADPPVIVQAT